MFPIRSSTHKPLHVTKKNIYIFLSVLSKSLPSVIGRIVVVPYFTFAFAN